MRMSIEQAVLLIGVAGVLLMAGVILYLAFAASFLAGLFMLGLFMALLLAFDRLA